MYSYVELMSSAVRSITDTWERHNIVVADAVRVLGVLGSVSGQACHCCQRFFQLRQLCRVRRSLDNVSVATLVHAFVTSRIDYCNGLLAGAPKVVTDKLQRVGY